MKQVKTTDLSQQQTINQKEYTFEKVFRLKKGKRCLIEKIKIHIKFTPEYIVIYSQNGAVLRVLEGLDVLQKPENFNNMDQIHSLYWQGSYDQNKKKDGQWVACWNKELIKNVGGYYKQGQKQGLWKDLFQNYSNNTKIFGIGEYYNDFRIGKWNYLYKDKKIGGGSHNKGGQKKGRWIEIDEEFYDDKKVTYNGEYNISGMKVDRWDIMYCKENEWEYKLINISKQQLQINIVVVDHMITKEIRKRLESGQN